jgi:hypothetical protein
MDHLIIIYLYDFQDILEMKDETPTTWQVLISILMSFFGVQNEETRQRDFTHGKPSQFIIIGLIITFGFILVLYLLVKLVLLLTLGG